jgi:GT2 family glycosyltransferase
VRVKKSRILNDLCCVEAVVSEYCYIERIDVVMRLYVKIIAGDISVFYRMTHDYLYSFKDNEVGRGKLLELIDMSRDDFYKMLGDRGIVLPNKSSLDFIRGSFVYKESESWFVGAWLGQTRRLLEDMGVPIEKVFEYLP